MSRSASPRGPKLPAVHLKEPGANGPTLERVLVEVAAAEAAGDVDLLEGGVTADRIAPHTSVSRDAIERRLILLARRGRLEPVHGKDPDSNVIRRSYRLADGVAVPDREPWGEYGGDDGA